MKLSGLLATAVVIGGSLFIPVSVEAQSYYGRTNPTFANPAGRSYSTYQNRNYNSFSGNKNSYGTNGFHGNCTGTTCRKYRSY
jgi:hypothetical protein